MNRFDKLLWYFYKCDASNGMSHDINEIYMSADRIASRENAGQKYI